MGKTYGKEKGDNMILMATSFYGEQEKKESIEDAKAYIAQQGYSRDEVRIVTRGTVLTVETKD